MSKCCLPVTADEDRCHASHTDPSARRSSRLALTLSCAQLGRSDEAIPIIDWARYVSCGGRPHGLRGCGMEGASHYTALALSAVRSSLLHCAVLYCLQRYCLLSVANDRTLQLSHHTRTSVCLFHMSSTSSPACIGRLVISLCHHLLLFMHLFLFYC